MDSSAESIADYHTRVLGWPAIGYHFIVHWDGRIDWCHDLEVMSYHVAGRNRECVGVCLPGNWAEQAPPEVALAALSTLLDWLAQLLPDAELVGHREVVLPGYATSCPGDALMFWTAMLRP